MKTRAEIIADSTFQGSRVITFSLHHWRAYHAEFLKHRMLEVSASSSRAIPVKKMLSQVWSEPAGPIHWGKNQAGMQAREELCGWRKGLSRFLWKATGKAVCVPVWMLTKLGLHKQAANRILEPWQYISVIATGNLEWWQDLLALRNHPDAQPEFAHLAQMIEDAIAESEPQELKSFEWHIPYVTKEERATLKETDLIKASAARCARASYRNHEGKEPVVSKDLLLYDRLAGATPPHLTPLGHQLQASPEQTSSGNIRGPWLQFRQTIGGEDGKV